MNKLQYLADPHVSSFIDFMVEKETEDSFQHEYTALKPRMDWNCHSVFNAYENYWWNNVGFEETSAMLGNIQTNLRNALIGNDSALEHCHGVLKWGGVLSKGNKARLENLGRYASLNVLLTDAMERLNPGTFQMTHDLNDLNMTSGFSKIYSLIIDDFAIYDSRVGAALGLLVRKYCEENNKPEIPANLKFAYANARETKGHVGKIRNPSQGVYRFPILTARNYIHNNMKANWLLHEIVNRPASQFNQLPSPMRSLESALFMIGYKVN